jgi:hypothetical protein
MLVNQNNNSSQFTFDNTSLSQFKLTNLVVNDLCQFDMNICPLYSPLNDIWMHMTKKRKEQSSEEETTPVPKKKVMLSKISTFENDLDYLHYEWTTINIVLQSIRNAFTFRENMTDEYLNEVDKELSIAYDDLMAQVRQLDRRLKRMTADMKSQLGDSSIGS